MKSPATTTYALTDDIQRPFDAKVKKLEKRESNWQKYGLIVLGIISYGGLYLIWKDNGLWAGTFVFFGTGFAAKTYFEIQHQVLDIEWLQNDREWLKDRLHLVDPSWRDDFLAMTPDNPGRRQPPADEVVGYCPKCEQRIMRRALSWGYNGGYVYMDRIHQL